mmetsp:Transcript_134953/g.269291  ORF Transcript_134953/g.269291 Transcript_134953/m.269291 type:complete len:91 (+) Transcript_134953:1276-1548(+)
MLFVDKEFIELIVNVVLCGPLVAAAVTSVVLCKFAMVEDVLAFIVGGVVCESAVAFDKTACFVGVVPVSAACGGHDFDPAMKGGDQSKEA